MRCILFVLLVGCFPVQEDVNVVRGQVLYGGLALPGALVRLVLAADATTAHTALTGDNGEYRFPDVAAGDYMAVVSTDRWTVENAVSLPVVVGAAGLGQTHPVARDITLEVVRLTPAGVVTGDLDGSALAGAELEGTLVRLDKTPYETHASADGHFDFGRVAVGSYEATATGPAMIAQARAHVLAEQNEALRLRLTPVTAATGSHVPRVGPLEVATVASTGDVLADVSRLGPKQLLRGSSMRVRCPASTVDGNALDYAWQVSGGTFVQLQAEEIEWTAASGTASIRCTVTDAQGASVISPGSSSASASIGLEVVDYRLAGAALGSSRVVFSQSDAGVPDFDLVVHSLTGDSVRLSAPGQQTRPHVFGETVIYVSDNNGTGPNPLDVYGRALPTGAQVRLSSSDGVEAYDIGPAGIAVARAGCQVGLRASLSAAESIVFPSSVAAPTNGAVCDRLVVGQTSVLVREALPSGRQWRLVDLIAGGVTNAPTAWDADTGISVVFNGVAYVAAVPSAGKVFRFSETFASLLPIGALPALSGTPTASVAARGTTTAWTAYDDTGSFGDVRGVSIPPTTTPLSVLGVSPEYVLVGVPQGFEEPPSHELRLVRITP